MAFSFTGSKTGAHRTGSALAKTKGNEGRFWLFFMAQALVFILIGQAVSR